MNVFERGRQLALDEYRELTGHDYDPETLSMMHVYGVPISSRSLFLHLESVHLSRLSPDFRKVKKDMEQAIMYGTERG